MAEGAQYVLPSSAAAASLMSNTMMGNGAVDKDSKESYIKWMLPPDLPKPWPENYADDPSDPFLIKEVKDYVREFGKESALREWDECRNLHDYEFPLTGLDMMEFYYNDYFYKKPHVNYIAVYKDEENNADFRKIGPVVISVEDWRAYSAKKFLRVLINSKKGPERLCINLPDADSVKEFDPIIEVKKHLSYYATVKFSLVKPYDAKEAAAKSAADFDEDIDVLSEPAQLKHQQEKDSKTFVNLEQELSDYERKTISKNYKFGVIYCKDHEDEENQWYNNEHGSEEFDRFLEILGTKIKLEGWTDYRGGLDVKKNTTGKNSVFTTYQGCKIMFHVSTLIHFTPGDPQQVERKRHTGNDIVLLIFRQGENTPFDPSLIRSHFNHVFIIVTPVAENKYMVAVTCKDGVPYYSPQLLWPPTFEFPNPLDPNDMRFRSFLLSKMINGQNAALLYAPDFIFKFRQTRKLQLTNILGSVPSAQLEHSKKLTNFISKKIDQTGSNIGTGFGLLHKGKNSKKKKHSIDSKDISSPTSSDNIYISSPSNPSGSNVSSSYISGPSAASGGGGGGAGNSAAIANINKLLSQSSPTFPSSFYPNQQHNTNSNNPPPQHPSFPPPSSSGSGNHPANNHNNLEAANGSGSATNSHYQPGGHTQEPKSPMGPPPPVPGGGFLAPQDRGGSSPNIYAPNTPPPSIPNSRSNSFTNNTSPPSSLPPLSSSFPSLPPHAPSSSHIPSYPLPQAPTPLPPSNLPLPPNPPPTSSSSHTPSHPLPHAPNPPPPTNLPPAPPKDLSSSNSNANSSSSNPTSNIPTNANNANHSNNLINTKPPLSSPRKVKAPPPPPPLSKSTSVAASVDALAFLYQEDPIGEGKAGDEEEKKKELPKWGVNRGRPLPRPPVSSRGSTGGRGAAGAVPSGRGAGGAPAPAAAGRGGRPLPTPPKKEAV